MLQLPSQPVPGQTRNVAPVMRGGKEAYHVYECTQRFEACCLTGESAGNEFADALLAGDVTITHGHQNCAELMMRG